MTGPENFSGNAASNTDKKYCLVKLTDIESPGNAVDDVYIFLLKEFQPYLNKDNHRDAFKEKWKALDGNRVASECSPISAEEVRIQLLKLIDGNEYNLARSLVYFCAHFFETKGETLNDIFVRYNRNEGDLVKDQRRMPIGGFVLQSLKDKGQKEVQDAQKLLESMFLDFKDQIRDPYTSSVLESNELSTDEEKPLVKKEKPARNLPGHLMRLYETGKIEVDHNDRPGFWSRLSMALSNLLLWCSFSTPKKLATEKDILSLYECVSNKRMILAQGSRPRLDPNEPDPKVKARFRDLLDKATMSENTMSAGK